MSATFDQILSLNRFIADRSFLDSGLYFGAGADLGAATFFSGLIDDVRIYDVALTPEEVAALAQ